MTRGAALVLGIGIGSAIQPLIALAGWLIWHVDTRPKKAGA